MTFGQSVECQIFVIVIFFKYGQVLQFRAHSRNYKNALTQKGSFLVIFTTFRFKFHDGWKNQNKHSTLNSSFDPLSFLSKWYEPKILKKLLPLSVEKVGVLGLWGTFAKAALEMVAYKDFTESRKLAFGPPALFEFDALISDAAPLDVSLQWKEVNMIY